MKKYLRLIASILVFVPVLSLTTTAFVNAESNTGSSSSSTTSSTPSSSDSESADDAGLLKRLTDRKATLKTKLNTLEQDRLKLKCKVSQTGPVTSLSGRIKGIETSRSEVYKN